MGVSRRDFLKLTGATAVAGAVGGTVEAEARERENRILGAKVTTSVCAYCSVGCSMLVYSKEGRVVHIEGDPESPINGGTLCSKGASYTQLVNSDKRVTKPLYRAPNAASWQEVEWEWAIDEIAKRVKKSRDASFKTTDDKGQVVNRTDAIASVGSAALDNEECYIYQKWLRSLGLVYIEHQARI